MFCFVHLHFHFIFVLCLYLFVVDLGQIWIELVLFVYWRIQRMRMWFEQGKVFSDRCKWLVCFKLCLLSCWIAMRLNFLWIMYYDNSMNVVLKMLMVLVVISLGIKVLFSVYGTVENFLMSMNDLFCFLSPLSCWIAMWWSCIYRLICYRLLCKEEWFWNCWDWTATW